MRLADIKVGELYAWRRSKGSTTFGTNEVVFCVKAMEVGVHRKVRDGYRSFNSANADGVEVMVMRGSLVLGLRNGYLTKVPANQIVRTWEEQEPLEMEKAAKLQAELERRQEAVEWNKQVTDRLDDPLFADIRANVRIGIPPTRSILFKDEAADWILDALKDWTT